LALFILGTAVLVGLGLVAQDPLWSPWSSVRAACAARATAPRVLDALLQRRVTWRTAGLWYLGAAAPYDVAQVVYLGASEAATEATHDLIRDFMRSRGDKPKCE
jgi:hypothetical protein